MRRPRNRFLRYPRLALFVVCMLVLFALADTGIAHSFLALIGGYGYAGAIVTGMFFVSLFTVVPATVILIHLAE